MSHSLTICRIVGILSFTLFLSGCFSSSTNESYLSLSCTDLGQNVAEAYQGNSFCDGEYPSLLWWEMFGDQQLNQMIELALCCNPTIEQVRQRIVGAYQKAVEVRSKLLPTIDLFGSYSRERNSLYDIGIPAFVPLVEGDNLWFNTATLLLKGSYEVDVWGRNRNAYYASLGQLQGRIADYAQARLVLSTRIAQTYFNFQSHLKQLQLLQEKVEEQRELVNLMRQRFKRGEADEFFPFITDTQLAGFEDELKLMKGLVEIDRHALAELVGNISSLCEGESATLCVRPSAEYQNKMPLPCSVPLDLISHRPDIMASLWNVESKGHEIKVAKANFYPNLDLFASVGSVAFLISKFMNPNAFSLFGSASSTLPVYTGGELRAKLGQAQSDLDYAVSLYNETVLKAIKEVCDAITNLKTSDERFAYLTEAVRDSSNIASLTTQRFESKISTKIDYLNAKLALVKQEILQEETHLARMVALVEMISSLGGGYHAG